MRHFKMFGTFILAVGLSLFISCGKSSSGTPTMVGCNPISVDSCFLPFPSFYYLVKDTSTATGWRVNYPSGVLPVNNKGVPLDPSPFNHADGFSPASQILAYFTEGVLPASLPSINDIGASISPTSPIQIIDFTTGTRVPLFAEVDANAQPGQRQGLIIRPMVRLNTSTRYVVVILNTVKAANGTPLQAPVPFIYLRDKIATSNPAVEGIRQHYEGLFSFLSANGISRSSIALAWDFTTASDSFITGHLISMRDQALAMTPSVGINYTFTTITPSPDAYLYKELIGTFSAPTFLDSNNYLVTDTTTGRPEYVGEASYNIVVHIPACVTQTKLPIPIMIFGHGLFGTAESEMQSGFEESFTNQLCMVQIGTDWIGLSTLDFPDAILAVQDFNNFRKITDRLQQAQVNVVVMTKLALGALRSDPNMQYNGKPIIGNKIYYYGDSDGGIQGGTFMGIDPDVIRGVLGVPGSTWSIMMQRSYDFGKLSSLFDTAYPDPLDRLILISLSQYFWDFSDPISFAPHILLNPLAGTPKKQILIQAGLNDCQVPNLSTEVLARTMGITALSPLPISIYGIPLGNAPLASAFTLWNVPDSSVYVPPTTNTMPAKDNNVHEDVRRLTETIQQDALFFTEGTVQQTCLATNGCMYLSPTSLSY